MRADNLTRREFIGVAAAVLGIGYTPSSVVAKETISKWPASGDDRERLEDVSVYVYPIEGTNKIRIFEISNQYSGMSGFSDVDKNNGREFMYYTAIDGSPKESDHNGIMSYLMCSAKDHLLMREAGLR